MVGEGLQENSVRRADGTGQGKIYRNPVISGFYPDPSVLRVGDDFYLVTSSFEYFPAVPIFHSKDLVNWKQIGHILDRESQVNLDERRSSSGIYAATLRYHDGRFYMITTDVRGIGNFYVWAERPEGPYSDPIRIPYGNIDPSLMFDDDGKAYVTAQNGEGAESHIIQYEIDIRTGEALTEPVVVCRGDGGVWTEGPHLYKINGMYYVFCACGGTGEDHRELVARSSHVFGPYELYPQPVLTHNQMQDHPLQYIGHADLVDDRNGNWWAVFLGVRPVPSSEGSFTLLGRETFLAPVIWTEDGWPVIDNNVGNVGFLMETDGLLAPQEETAQLEQDDFDGSVLDLSWAFVRTEPKNSYSLTERPGWLRLKGNALTLSDVATPACVLKRQRHFRMRMSACMEFHPRADGEEAGLCVRYNDSAHYEIGVKNIAGERFVVVSCTMKGVTEGIGRMKLMDDAEAAPVFLAVTSDEEAYSFSCSSDGQEWRELGSAPTRLLSTNVNAGFLGVCAGLYATGNGTACQTPADFDWFRYEIL
ncbi:glycoside hydrolase family 43 protein [Gorillibacterium massiliense]|uniref:glycoside hydrolase family 43 protein n=1 Tax=Gorillibacterium massiliense TaxID=1280390 RepID=UPI0004B520BF|nr:glycoside hydrolase family 43 protein [Gorillibacterium massiliense]